MTRPPETADFVLPFQFDDLGIRGRFVRLGSVAEAVVRTHDYPPAVGEMLAQSLALSAALSSALKFDGVFTLQTKGSGPIATLVADTTSKGDMRGYAGFDAERLRQLPEGSGSQSPVPRLLGTGYLAFTVDQGPHTERYQGIVELAGATLADCAHQYLRRSEQIEAGVRLAAGKGAELAGSAPWRSGALMLQRLPPAGGGGAPMGDEAVSEAAGEGWRRALALMSSVTDRELLDCAIAPYDLLHRLFHEERVTVLDAKPLAHRCRCSTLRVQRALASIPFSELESLKVEGRVRVVCQFCNAVYEFDDDALRRFRAAG
jgi:molecular chaperone Hsp33